MKTTIFISGRKKLCFIDESGTLPDTKSHQKTALTAVLVSQTSLLNDWIDTLDGSIQQNLDFVKSENITNIMGVDLPGVEPGRLGVSTQSSKPAKPTPKSLSQNNSNTSINLADFIAGATLSKIRGKNGKFYEIFKKKNSPEPVHAPIQTS